MEENKQNITVSQETISNIYKALMSAQEYLKELDRKRAKEEKGA